MSCNATSVAAKQTRRCSTPTRADSIKSTTTLGPCMCNGPAKEDTLSHKNEDPGPASAIASQIAVPRPSAFAARIRESDSLPNRHEGLSTSNGQIDSGSEQSQESAQRSQTRSSYWKPDSHVRRLRSLDGPTPKITSLTINPAKATTINPTPTTAAQPTYLPVSRHITDQAPEFQSIPSPIATGLAPLRDRRYIAETITTAK